MKKSNKLVRDNIIKIIEADNKKATFRILDDKSYIEELNLKLSEEVDEYLEDFNIIELADIQEVIEALVVAKGYSLKEFNDIKAKKKNKLGAFENKIFLEGVITDDE